MQGGLVGEIDKKNMFDRDLLKQSRQKFKDLLLGKHNRHISVGTKLRQLQWGGYLSEMIDTQLATDSLQSLSDIHENYGLILNKESNEKFELEYDLVKV